MSVYFVASSGTGLVKIGYATDTARRVKTLQTATPHELSLIGEFPGTAADEAVVHRALAGSGRTGEWFDGRLAREFLADAERLGLLEAAAAWRDRYEAWCAASRAECRDAAKAFCAAALLSFEKLVERRGEAAVKSLLKMGPARFAKRKLQGTDTVNLFILSEPDEKERLRRGWAELLAPPSNPPLFDSKSPDKLTREDHIRKAREHLLAAEEME